DLLDPEQRRVEARPTADVDPETLRDPRVALGRRRRVVLAHRPEHARRQRPVRTLVHPARGLAHRVRRAGALRPVGEPPERGGVGTATSGGMRVVIGVPPYSYSAIDPPWTTSTPTDFAVSIELPPPRATRPSQPDSR